MTIDPFYLYLHMVEALGEGRAFLLDAAAETTSKYQMSLVAGAPVLEVQVKDGVTTLFAARGLGDYLVTGLAERNVMSQNILPTAAAPSVVGEPVATYSSVDPMALLEHLRALMRTLYYGAGAEVVPFSAGFLGYIGYDAVHYLEVLPKTTLDDRNLPDIRLQVHTAVVQLVGDRVHVFDGTKALAAVVAPDVMADIAADLRCVQTIVDRQSRSEFGHSEQLSESSESGPSDVLNRLVAAAKTADTNQLTARPPVSDDVTQAAFEQNVRTARAYIEAGDIFQIVLSKRIRVPKQRHPYLVYDALRRVNPSPYMFIGEYPDMRIFGASPEVQFRSVAGQAEMKPLAGTSKGRGKTQEEDDAKRDALFRDEKERAEHVMLVDLCRNDLGRVSDIGSVSVRGLMHVEAYSHLFHLVSEVVSHLRADVSVFHALLATFPAGTLSGAPKIRAMEIIDELETLRRGPYGGMIGMVDFDANANTAIVIRTIVECQDTYFVQVGAGIVADSDETQEWLECAHKAGAVLQVLGVTEAQ